MSMFIVKNMKSEVKGEFLAYLSIITRFGHCVINNWIHNVLHNTITLKWIQIRPIRHHYKISTPQHLSGSFNPNIVRLVFSLSTWGSMRGSLWSDWPQHKSCLYAALHSVHFFVCKLLFSKQREYIYIHSVATLLDTFVQSHAVKRNCSAVSWHCQWCFDSIILFWNYVTVETRKIINPPYVFQYNPTFN